MKANLSRFTLILVLVLALSGLWVVYTSIFLPSPAAAIQAAAPREGFSAPDFTVTTYEGETIRLSELRGTVVFLNFWTSWCPPCKEEMPAIQQLHDLSPETAVLAVNLTDQDNLTDVEDFLDKVQINLDIALDKDGAISKLYQIDALPTSFFIDKRGIIRKVIYGGPISKALLFAEIGRLAEEP